MESGMEEEEEKAPISFHMQTGGLERGYKVLRAGYHVPQSSTVPGEGRLVGEAGPV